MKLILLFIYNKMLQLFTEAIVIGIVMVIIGLVILWVISLIWKQTGKDWNKYYVMGLALFLTGFIGHLFFEFTGLNKKYCTSGYACT